MAVRGFNSSVDTRAPKDNISEYVRMCRSVGFINVPSSRKAMNNKWLEMVQIIKKETNNTPSRIRNRQTLIDILKRRKFYTNNKEWIERECPGANQFNDQDEKNPTSDQVTLVPLYRYYNGKEHLYTTNAQEIGTTTHGQKGHHGYKSERIAGYISPEKVDGYSALYRYHNQKDHLYTTNAQEIGTVVSGATGKLGYKCEGVAGWVLVNQIDNSIPLYRYCNGTEHFYTCNGMKEIGTIKSGAKGNGGWICEGIACYVFPKK